jgi:FkbM family methyltransferase
VTETVSPARSWQLRTDRGVAIQVPDRVSSLTSFVLLEQERWFEAELEFVPRLLAPDALALDVGANHGVYTLALAQHLRQGHVWAFEPTAEPRTRLLRSVEENGFGSRVTVMPIGLSDRARETEFAVGEHSELNSLHGRSARRERVRLDTLDAVAAQALAGRRIEFVKLDAEGEESAVLAGGRRFFAEHEPIVMFEFRHADREQLELVDHFVEAGHVVCRYLPEPELLVEFDPAADERTFVLNLFAVPLSRVVALERARLLVRRASMTGATVPADPAGSPYLEALRRTIGGHTERERPAAERLALLRTARDDLQAALDRGDEAGPEAWTLLVHLTHALGQTAAALELAGQLLRQWTPGLTPSRPVMPPQRADLDLARTGSDEAWLRLRLAEFVEMRRAYSSLFAPPDLERLKAIVSQPDHRPEMARRLALNMIRRDQPPPAELLRAIAHDASGANGALWRSLAEAFAAPRASGSGPDAAPDPDAALALLAQRQDRPVEVVDVGASRLGEEREPYAPLVAAGLARVTGFEPDAAALADLRRAYPDADRHRFLPHLVGDGQPAVFHQTSWFMTSSLLPPNRPVLDAFHALGNLVQLARTEPVETCRLDDVIEPGCMDLLKIDVQGAEGLVFDGARERLRECLVVWTEVEFVPLYEGQPLFGDIDRTLRAAGLEFHSFAGLAHRALATWPTGSRGPRRPQTLWSDAIYLPGIERRAMLDDHALARLALIAHAVVGAHDVSHAALLELDRRSGRDDAPRYLAALGVTAR